MFGKYGAYTVQQSQNGADAVAIRELDGGLQEIKLYRTEHALYEGVSGTDISGNGIALSGSCHMTRGTWAVEFLHYDTSNPPFRKSPFLESERIKIFERLDLGKGGDPRKRIVVKMEMPKTLEPCYCKLIAWQAFIARRRKVKIIYYHLPTLEYHHHLAEIERAMGKAIPEAHAHLEVYAALMRAFILKVFEGIEVRFIEPFPFAAGDPTYSYLLPYFKSNLFGIPTEGLIGIENMVEVRLAYEAAKRGGPIIPVVACVVDIPNPWFEKGDGNNIIVLEL